MNKHYAIFDMDGTLIDSMPYWARLGTEYLTSKGIVQIPPSLKDTIKAMTISESASYFCEEFSLPEAPSVLADEMNALMNSHYRKNIPLKPGIESYLKGLYEKGVQMCVASATEEALINACLNRLGVAHYFSFTLSCETVHAGKTQPDIYMEAAKRLDAMPQDIAVYEDALYALNTAKKAGFYTIGVYDHSNKHQLEEIKAISHEFISDWTTL